MASQPVFPKDQPAEAMAPVVADKWLRVAGYLIDVVPAVILGLVALIPVVGIIIAGLLLTPYWLLRDVGGASLGKVLLGMRIVMQDGQPASTGARVLRNLTLIPAPLCMIIPLIGYILVIPVASVVILVEGIMLLSQGSRLGDKLAGTVVVRKL